MRTLVILLAVAGALAAAGCSEPTADPAPDSAADRSSGTFTVFMPAGSMEPTIEQDSSVVVTEVGEDFEPTRGQIVMFDDPGGWLSSDPDHDGSLLKRVIGVAGDTVRCCDAAGRIVVNGEPVEEPYLADSDTCAGGGMMSPDGDCDWAAGPVPAGTMFVLGDNRSASADSRVHPCPTDLPDCVDGPFVDVGLIRGTVDEGGL